MESVVQKAQSLPACGRFPTAGYMDVPLPGRTICRMDGDSRGVRLICLDGIVWVTQPADAIDYVLSAGQSFTVTHPGTVLVQGLPEGHLRLAPVIHGFGKPSNLWRTRNRVSVLAYSPCFSR